MNIILGKENVQDPESKYLILELDTLIIDRSQDPVTAFCLVESIPIDQIASVDQYRELHQNLLKNYRIKNWKFCEDAIEHLIGKWGGELDEFYRSIYQRVMEFKQQDPGPDWDGSLDRSSR